MCVLIKICPLYIFNILVLKKLYNRNETSLLPISLVMKALTATVGKRFNY